jgi:hypothetical protein
MPVTYIPSNPKVKEGGFGYKIARQEVTFAATAPGNQTLFTVTGDVIARILGVVDTTLTSAGGGVLAVGCGTEETNVIGGYIAATELAAREIWHDMSPDSETEELNVMNGMVITDGNDVVLYYKTAAIDTGAIDFYCFWTPLSAGATVVSA